MAEDLSGAESLLGLKLQEQTRAERVSGVARNPVPPRGCAGGTPYPVRGATGQGGDTHPLRAGRARTVYWVP